MENRNATLRGIPRVKRGSWEDQKKRSSKHVKSSILSNFFFFFFWKIPSKKKNVDVQKTKKEKVSLTLMPQTLIIIQPDKIISLRPTICLLIKRSSHSVLMIRICKTALNGDLIPSCSIRGNLIRNVKIVTIDRHRSCLYDVDTNLRRAVPADRLDENGSQESEGMKKKKKGHRGRVGEGGGFGYKFCRRRIGNGGENQDEDIRE